MRYMVIERFKTGKAGDVFRRFTGQGRMTPAGLRYVDSWITADLQTCYQLMEADDLELFAIWTRQWEDLIEFEIMPVIPAAEARNKALASS